MTLSNLETVRQFARGATSGRANSMEIDQLAPGVTALYSYDAVLAIRDDRDKRFTLFEGWDDYVHPRSRTTGATNEHFHLAERAIGTWTDRGWSLDRSADAPHDDPGFDGATMATSALKARYEGETA